MLRRRPTRSVTRCGPAANHPDIVEHVRQRSRPHNGPRTTQGPLRTRGRRRHRPEHRRIRLSGRTTITRFVLGLIGETKAVQDSFVSPLSTGFQLCSWNAAESRRRPRAQAPCALSASTRRQPDARAGSVGGHTAPINANRAQLGDHAKALRSFDGLRITRNRTDYPTPVPLSIHWRPLLRWRKRRTRLVMR